MDFFVYLFFISTTASNVELDVIIKNVLLFYCDHFFILKPLELSPYYKNNYSLNKINNLLTVPRVMVVHIRFSKTVDLVRIHFDHELFPIPTPSRIIYENHIPPQPSTKT